MKGVYIMKMCYLVYKYKSSDNILIPHIQNLAHVCVYLSLKIEYRSFS